MAALLIFAGVGCGGGDDEATGSAGSGSGGGGAGSGTGGGDSTGTGGTIFPSGGGPTGPGSGGGNNCDPVLTGVVRDFRAFNGGAGHPDFETFGGDGLKGIVKDELGADHKPVYAHPGETIFTTGPDEFNQWYRDVDGVNNPISFTIVPTIEDGIATYDNPNFFPIDGKGFGNEGRDHNFHFTFELHMTFTYNGGEVFTFTGDDDLWVFMNDKLAIDLGGLHSAQSETIKLDEQAEKLGLEVGKQYPLDFFHAERHTNQSNFRIQSSLTFTNCTPIVY